MRRKTISFIIIYTAIPLFLAVFLLFSNIPVNGEITQTYQPGSFGTSRIVSAPYPGNRIDNVIRYDNEPVLPIINDNAYFDVKFPPFAYENINLHLEFIRPDEVPEVRLGIPRGPEQYENIVLSNKYLDNLEWNAIKEGYLTLWQKEPLYETISEFLTNPPPDKLTAVHNSAPTPQLILPNYEPRRQTVSLPVTLLGSHSLFTYIKNEPLFFAFKKSSENPENETTTEFVRVLDFQGREIAKYELTDSKSYEINITDLPTGLYRLEITVAPTSRLYELETTLSKLVARNYLDLAPNPDANNIDQELRIDLAGSNLTTETSADDGRQIISAAGKDLHLTAVNKPLVWRQYYPELKNSGQLDIVLQKQPVKLTATGYFSLGRTDLLFNPEPPYTFKMSPETTAEQLEAADFVIAKYNQPEKTDGETIYTNLNLPIPSLYQPDDGTTFAIFTPGLDRDCEQIYLQKIGVTLTRPSLSWAEIKRLGTKLFQRN